MIHSFLLVFVAPEDFFPVEWLRVRDFVSSPRIQSRPFQGITDISFGAKRASSPATSLTSGLMLYPSDRGTSGITEAPPAGGGWATHSPTPPSGLPIGGEFHVRAPQGDGLLSLVASSRFSTFDLSMTLHNLPGSRWRNPPAHDWTNDLKIAEYVARYAMSRGAGSRLGTVTNRQFNGYLARAATCTKTNRVMVDVRDWASAKDWSVEETAEPGYLTLRKGTRWAVIPSAAASIKVDGQWRAIPDLVMVKSGRWMFPVSSADGI